MSLNSIVCVLFATFISSTIAVTCNNVEVLTKSFTTEDATIVSQIAYIAEFSLKCSNKEAESQSLFAEIDGKLTPVARVGDKFQVSWNEEIKKSRSGSHNVRLFDEEGFAAVRKAQRSGEDIDSLRSLATVVVNHPGAFKGPWVNSEILAAVLATAVAYIAFSTKSKLLS